MKRLTQRVTRIGGAMANIVLPNIAAFIACGLIMAVCAPHGWWPNATVFRVVAPMQTMLLPLLLAFTGGSNVAGHRGGVVASIAAIGVITNAQVASLFAVMLIGPVAGWCVNRVDDWLRPHVRQGFEMLVNNFSAGILGILLALVGFFGLAPVADACATGLAWAVNALVVAHWLPLVNLIVEPGKVLFLNNALNHGILTPLGTDAATRAGKSVLFLVETNPGPGLGILLACRFFGRGHMQRSAGEAAIIQFFGGIHEIYFPYVLMQPRLLLAAIAGGISGTYTFVGLNAGLIAVPSPGSIISILLLTPRGWANLLAVGAGVAVATVVAFIVASGLLAFQRTPHAVPNAQPHHEHAVRTLVVTGTAGMGTPAMGAALLRQQLAALDDITVSVVSVPIGALTPDHNAVYITRNDLIAVVHDQLPGEIRVVGVANYLHTPVYAALVAELKQAW